MNASEENLPARGRATQGVRGIRLKADDELMTMQVADENADLVTSN